MTFSHDGLRDSLTHLAAPPYFYENLRREIAMAERNRSRLLLIRFQLIPRDAFDAQENIGTIERESKYEVEILAFAELIKSATRPEDLCARLGKYEFTMIVKADQSVGRALTQRVLSGWNSEQFNCLSAQVMVKQGESSLEILNRLDNQQLRPISLS